MLTDLAITGKPAQFGRGVMQDVSDKLLGQFVACLEQRLGGDGAAERRPAEPPPAAPSRPPPTAAAAPAPEADAAGGLAPRHPGAARPRPDDALNLGSTVLPILARTYWKQGLAVLVVVALVIWLIAR